VNYVTAVTGQPTNPGRHTARVDLYGRDSADLKILAAAVVEEIEKCRQIGKF